MNLAQFIVLAVSSLFVIVDPVATVPAFLAMTASHTPEQRLRAARTAATVTVALLLVFAYAGRGLFQVLGITLPAFQMAGGLVLLLVALDMVRAQRSRVQETAEETEAGSGKDDIAITPLAVPMLAGPGAFSTVVLLSAKARSLDQHIALGACVVVVGVASYAVLALSAHGARWLSPIALRVTSRIMGLLLAAIAVQFIINGVQEILPRPPAG